MNGIARHGAPEAKARALMGRLLKPEDYRQLMQASSFREFVDYLVRNTVYAEVFPDHQAIQHRNEVELGMRQFLFKNFEKFYHYYYDTYRTFFKVLFMRYEVENLKLIVRAITRQEDVRRLKGHLIISEIFSYVDYGKIFKAASIREFNEALAGTPYAQVLRAYEEESASKMQFYMEMNLDRLYFKRIQEVTAGFDRKDRRLLMELLGINSDLLNIQWIYRAKKFYGLSSEEILNYTLETGLKYDYQRLKNLCYMDSAEEMQSSIAKSPYGMLFNESEILMERNMERYLFSYLDEMLRKGQHSIAVPLAYIHKLEYEIRDLFSILECIKYSVVDIEPYLVRQLVGR